MNFTTSGESSSLGFYFVSGLIYGIVNVLVIYSFLDLASSSLIIVCFAFGTAQITSVTLVYNGKNMIKSFTSTVSALWALSTRSKSDSMSAVREWIKQGLSDELVQPEVLSVSPNQSSGRVEIEVVSKEGFGFLYGDITDISAQPDEVEFAKEDVNGSKFTTCYFCRDTRSSYNTGVRYKSGSNCSHQHAICEDCIYSILSQLKPKLKEYTTTEELVATNI